MGGASSSSSSSVPGRVSPLMVRHGSDEEHKSGDGTRGGGAKGGPGGSGGSGTEGGTVGSEGGATDAQMASK